jgi:hypothetical protein
VYCVPELLFSDMLSPPSLDDNIAGTDGKFKLAQPAANLRDSELKLNGGLARPFPCPLDDDCHNFCHAVVLL